MSILNGVTDAVIRAIKSGKVALTPELERLLDSELAYQSVIAKPMLNWLQNVSPSLIWDWIYLLAAQRALEDAIKGDNKRIMFFWPPRHGKSTLTSQHFPAYVLDCDRKARVILASYSLDLSKEMSTEAQRLTKAAGMKLATKALDEWHIEEGGSVKAVGVGGGVTGRGADYLIIDDPIKSRAEAESETYRNLVWQWYTNDLRTRLEPGGVIILILTRWHEDDLAGRLLKGKRAHEWTVIKFPAIAEADDPLGRTEGEALCPARYDLDDLFALKDEMTSYEFSSLYQQSPTPAEGARFKRSWFRYWSEHGEFYCLHRPDGPHYVAKSECYIIQTIEPAATANKSSDFFVVGTFAVTPDRELITLDLFREQAETTLHEMIIMNQYRKWNPLWVGVEHSTYGINIFQRMRVLGLPIVALSADKDKVSRSLPIQARMEAGMVYFKLGADFTPVTEDELMHFPMGKHDDIVDTYSYAGIHLLNYGIKIPRKEDAPPPDDTRKKGSIAARMRHAGADQKERWDYE